MAYYNSVSVPRIYINIPEYLAYIGWSYGANIASDTIFRTLPVSPNIFMDSSFTIPDGLLGTQCFIAVLGHTLKTDNFNYEVTTNDVDGDGASTVETLTAIVNGTPASGYNGYSISTFSGGGTNLHISMADQTVEGDEPGSLGNISSVVAGVYFEFPHSPDLKLTLSYETGTKTIETKGGASLSNTMWRPPLWGNLGPWELNNPDSETTGQTLAHSSRRTWNLSFSFLDKTNTFPKYNALNRLVDQEETLPDDETLLTSDDFFSAVWNKVGTALPFIFQPDKDTPEFAICKFDQKNISFQQTLPSRYSVKCKIRECW